MHGLGDTGEKDTGTWHRKLVGAMGHCGGGGGGDVEVITPTAPTMPITAHGGAKYTAWFDVATWPMWGIRT